MLSKHKPSLVSVILPVYNGALYIADAIVGVFNQDYPNIELIVVDDGSQDLTAAIVKKFENVCYIYQDNEGPAKARNTGIRHANGDFIAFLDHDDIWDNNKITQQMAEFHADPELDHVICLQEIYLDKNVSKKPHWLKQEFLEKPQIGYLPSALLVKRIALESLGLFSEEYRYCSDVDWFFRAKDKGLKLKIIDRVLIKRRMHENNHSNMIPELNKDYLKIIRASIKRKRDQPLVSVIIPVHNGEKYVAETIHSALAQEYQPIELVVIDDGSTDKTAEIVQQFPQVKYYYQANSGLGAARNTGVRYAAGEYLAFVDADDLWLPEKLTLQMNKLLKEGIKDSLVFTHMEQFICSSLSREEMKKIKLEDKDKVIPGISGSSVALSKKTFEKIGNFFEIKQVGEFIDWYSRAQDLKIETIMLLEVLVRRRIHASNMGRQKQQYSQQQYLPVLKSILDRRRQLLHED